MPGWPTKFSGQNIRAENSLDIDAAASAEIFFAGPLARSGGGLSNSRQGQQQCSQKAPALLF